MVRTTGFQSVNQGSIPCRVTRPKSSRFFWSFLRITLTLRKKYVLLRQDRQSEVRMERTERTYGTNTSKTPHIYVGVYQSRDRKVPVDGIERLGDHLIERHL